MTRKLSAKPIYLLVAALALLPAGCSDDEATKPIDNHPATEAPDLDAAYGGFTTENETPAFGDAELEESAASEAEVDDDFRGDPDITNWQAPGAANIYAATILWGLMADDPATDSNGTEESPVLAKDWSGHLEVSRGAVLLRSTIAFEPNDRIERPRTDKTRIDWVSHTTTGYDGIRVVVFSPLDAPSSSFDETLTIVAGDHRWSFPVSDLAEMEFVEVVDDLGNKLAIRAFEIAPEACARGFVGGAWLAPEDTDEPGRFRGRWVSRDGSVAGFVRGYWGTRSDGQRVVFGKYIDRAGRFKGMLVGTWDEGPVETVRGGVRHRHGAFRGEWIDENETMKGHVRGHWRIGRRAGDGFFEGKWAEDCGKP